MKQSDEELRAQINDLIRDEIQENINDYVDEKESSPIGFANEEDELKVNIPESEVDKILREYKKIKRKEKSNMSQIKKLGLLYKNGRPL